MRSSVAVLVDQALWASMNFVTVALLARSLGVLDFGAFAVLLSVLLFLSGLTLARSSEALAIGRGIALKRDTGRRVLDQAESAAGAAISWALFAGAVAAAGSLWLAAADGGRDFLWLVTAWAPAAVVAESYRGIGYALRRRKAAFCVTFSWVTLQSLLLASALLYWGLTPEAILIPWVFGAYAGALAGVCALPIRPKFSRVSPEERYRRRNFSMEYALTAGPNQLMGAMAAPIFGLGAASFIRAMQTVFGPLNVLIAGLRNAVVPAASEELEGRPLRRVGQRVALSTMSATAVIGILLALFPEIGIGLMGENWPLTPSVLIAFVAGRVGAAGIFGAVVVLRAADETSLSAKLRVATFVLSLGPFFAVSFGGLVSALWAFSAGVLLAAAAWWRAAAKVTAAVSVRPGRHLRARKRPRYTLRRR